LKFKVVENNQLELLADRGGLPEFEPGSRDTMKAVV
jgi:hypothetical protein